MHLEHFGIQHKKGKQKSPRLYAAFQDIQIHSGIPHRRPMYSTKYFMIVGNDESEIEGNTNKESKQHRIIIL